MVHWLSWTLSNGKRSKLFGMIRLLAILVSFAAISLCAQQSEIARFDAAMAQQGVVVTNGMKWIDGRCLPIEGRAFTDVDHYYDRLPSDVTTNVNAGVRAMKHHTAGMQFRFTTDSRRLALKWIPYNAGLSMDHMPATGVSGVDIYRRDAANGRWRYVKTGRIWDAHQGGSLEIPWTPGEACLINLPLYNGVKSVTLGVETNATVSALGPRSNGVVKPVVFYGTSITHGGCCSRPGMSFVNIVGRELDVPVVNLGFSGSGRMEFEMSEHLARIDASCYVLDTLWNMNDSLVEERYEPFIRNLRAKRPGVPIVMVEFYSVHSEWQSSMDRTIRKLYEKLLSEGWNHLVYLPRCGMYVDDEGTVDGVHPNDWGMVSLAKGFEKSIREALELK